MATFGLERLCRYLSEKTKMVEKIREKFLENSCLQLENFFGESSMLLETIIRHMVRGEHWQINPHVGLI